MLDQLVESRSTVKENSRRSGFFLTIFVIMVSILISAWMYSLFAKDFGMGGSDLELSTLVAPVPVPESEPPPPPEPEQQPAKQIQQDNKQNVDVRREIIANIMESPTKVEKVSTEKSNVAERRIGAVTKIGNIDSNAAGAPSGPTRATGGNSGGGSRTIGPTETAKPDPPDIEEPPPAPPKPTPTPKPAPKTISGGVVNGKAISLPQPTVPAAAKAVRANGQVSVQILIDESGNVVSANASSGHPLLRGPAEQAARRAKFRPTELSGQPVKVSGVITYNFQ